MVTNSRQWRLNDHTLGRTIMTLSDIVVIFLTRACRWFWNVQFPYKQALFIAIFSALVLSWAVSGDGDPIKADPPTSSFVTVPTPVASTDSTVYDTGVLAGRKAGDLYAAYLGYNGKVIPTELKVDWTAQLDKLWTRKSGRRNVTSVARQAHEALVAEYLAKDPGKITLESYQEIAGNQARAICTELDWDQAGEIYRLNTRETALLKRVSCNMGGRVLLAYAMAELLPSTDGELNRDYLDFLLQHGGRRYVESLPALHDDLTSFGPLQFTQYAVYDTPRERRGASKVNIALPASSELSIPGSTLRLRENDHFRAAYMFAVSNLADGIRKLNGRQLAVFERVAGPRGVDVAQFIAVAHNKPVVGRQSLERWLDSGARGSYRDSCPRVSRMYATKTLNNYLALSPSRS